MNYEAPLDTGPDELGQGSGSRVWAGRLRSLCRRHKRAAIAGAFALFALVALLLFHQGGSSPLEEEQDGQLPVVTVIVPGTTRVTGLIEATGTLAARREMPVGSVGEGGRIVAVPVDAGDWVRKGQVLAVIDRSVQSQQVAGQRAQLDIARADARLAQANLDRALKLVERGFISQADVDRLTATRDSAVARVKLAEAQLAEMRARTSRLDIVAPAAGLLLTREAEPGQVVGGSTGPLFSIARGGELELLARLGEEELAQVTPGVEAQVTPVGSDKSFTGQVWQISPTIEEQTRQGLARIALSYDPALRPGGFASAEIRAGTTTAPLLPESAIQSDEKGSFVLIVGKGDKVVRRSVVTGQVTDAGIAIAKGLTGKERVVLRAGGFLVPGDRIKPSPAKAQAR